MRSYARARLEGVRAKLRAEDDTEDALYPYHLALFHEDMHGEALTYMRQTLDYPPHIEMPMPALDDDPSEVSVQGGTFALGSRPGEGFVFDNEKWAHPVRTASFRTE